MVGGRARRPAGLPAAPAAWDRPSETFRPRACSAGTRTQPAAATSRLAGDVTMRLECCSEKVCVLCAPVQRSTSEDNTRAFTSRS